MPRTSTVHAVTTIGIDMGKNTLHMIGLDTRGAIVWREKVSRGRIASRLANLPSCLIGIEAGLATHYVARELAALGHDVKQVPPTYAKPFRQGHKNDFRDAHSVAEAVQRPTTRFVPVKTDEQLDLQALHRVRSRLVSERTAVVNRFAAFFWNAASLSGKDCASFARRCPTSWPNAQTFSHHGWYASSLILPVTGGGSMRELNP
jgi:transposase